MVVGSPHPLPVWSPLALGVCLAPSLMCEIIEDAGVLAGFSSGLVSKICILPAVLYFNIECFNCYDFVQFIYVVIEL